MEEETLCNVNLKEYKEEVRAKQRKYKAIEHEYIDIQATLINRSTDETGYQSSYL